MDLIRSSSLWPLTPFSPFQKVLCLRQADQVIHPIDLGDTIIIEIQVSELIQALQPVNSLDEILS